METPNFLPCLRREQEERRLDGAKHIGAEPVLGKDFVSLFPTDLI
jgi:hypothetical protein